MKKTLTNKDGFTLIESMMSIVVLMVGILAVIQLFTVSINGRRNGKDLSIANNLAKRMIEDMKNIGVDSAINGMSTARQVQDAAGDVQYEYYASTAPSLNVRQQKIRTAFKEFTMTVLRELDTPDTDLTKVTITITWVGLAAADKPAPKTHTVQYVTYFY